VEIERFETSESLRRIYAGILVDKPNQKAIIIGREGEKLKAIGTQARKDMERLFGSKVFLELWVRVRSGWADDEAVLKRMGIE
jgi:GTP-binding protein Era